jgi:thiol-disulfide isomerase/thioredoxin
MGKASRTKQSVSRQQKIAAQRAAAKRAEQRRRLLLGGGSILAVVVIVVVFVIVKATSNGGSSAASGTVGLSGTSLTSAINQVTSVPASTLESVGEGSVSAKPQSISGSPAELKENGKPEVLYMGAEYCPYCAAERWAMIVALSRFGTFTGLQTMESSSSDVYANTPTWTFVDAKYTSTYLSFSTVEEENRAEKTLQTPTSAQQALITKYDAPPYVQSADAGSIPFVDFGNKYLIVGASYSPQTLDGLSWSKIGTDIQSPGNAVSKAIDGTANYITAGLCKLTGDAPANVCTSAITSLQSQI